MTVYVGEHEARLLVHKLRRHQPLVHCDMEGLDQLTEELAKTIIPDDAADSIKLEVNAVRAVDRETSQEYGVSFGRLIYTGRIKNDSSLESPYGTHFTSDDEKYFDSLISRLRASGVAVNEIRGSDLKFSLLARLRWNENGATFTRPLLITADSHNPTISNWEYSHQQKSRNLLRSIPGIGAYL